MKKVLIVLGLMVALCTPLWSQATHSMVPLGDNVYNILRLGEVKGLIRAPYPIKPYSQSVVVAALEEMLEQRELLLDLEILYIERELKRFTQEPRGGIADMALIDGELVEVEPNPSEASSLSEFLKDGIIVHASETVGKKEIPFSATIGTGLKVQFAGDMADMDQMANLNKFQLYLKGDLGRNVSYRVVGELMFNNINNPRIVGIGAEGSEFTFSQGSDPNNTTRNPQYNYLDFGAYAPFTFSKSWDGNHNGGTTWFENNSGTTVNWFPKNYALAYNFTSDISASFLDNRLQVRYGRDRHSLGPTDTGLFISPQARPFAAFEIMAQPVSWLKIGSIAGTLEYYYSELDHVNNPNKYYDAAGDYRPYMYLVMAQQQKMYSATVIELQPASWLTLGVVDSVVFPKRFELGYFNPFIFSFLYQAGIGDYDNTMLGGYVTLQFGNYVRAYGAINLDEARPGSGFFENARNTFAWQFGVEGSIPVLPLSVLKFQYTKIEPFTYTHNRVTVPNLSAGQRPSETGALTETGIDIAFSHNGEGFSSHLKPNSDEFLFDFEMAVSSPLTVGARYQLIRHGWLGSYNKDVDGNVVTAWSNNAGGEYFSPLEYSGGAYKNRPKSFLKDGTYEWFHIFGIRGEFDFAEYGAPLTIGGSFTYAHRYLTITPDADGDGYIDLGSDYEFKEGSRSNRFHLSVNLSYWL